jgi:hypothetical protein
MSKTIRVTTSSGDTRVKVSNEAELDRVLQRNNATCFVDGEQIQIYGFDSLENDGTYTYGPAPALHAYQQQQQQKNGETPNAATAAAVKEGNQGISNLFGTKRSWAVAPSCEAYAIKRQRVQEAREDALIRVPFARPKRKTQVTTTQSGLELCYPLPRNGSFYLPLEVVNILGTADRKVKGATILEWVKKKLVPVGKSAVYDCLSNAKKGRPVSDNWNEKGKKPLLTIAEIDEVGNTLRILRGSSLNRKDAEAAFTHKHKEKMVLQGLMPVGDKSVLSSTTIYNYMAIFEQGRPLPE